MVKEMPKNRIVDDTICDFIFSFIVLPHMLERSKGCPVKAGQPF